MKLHELKPAESSRRSGRRVGHDTSSGYGRTFSRGQKSQLARQGGHVRPDFEGDQVPLLRAIPKRGLKNINHKEYAVVNSDDLNKFENSSRVIIADLKVKGLVKKELSGVKLLASGELKVRATVKIGEASKAAEEAVDAASRSVEVIWCSRP